MQLWSDVGTEGKIAIGVRVSFRVSVRVKFRVRVRVRIIGTYNGLGLCG